VTTRTALNFHGIGAPSRDLDAGEGAYWIGEDRFTAILTRLVRDDRRDSTVITFDDGNASDVEVALPLLVRHGLTATFFLVTDRIDRPGSLSLDDIRRLRDEGMTIGSHGVAHRDWSALDRPALRTELRQSREILSEICGDPVDLAAIPFGNYTGGVLREIRAAGYSCAYSSDGGVMDTRRFLRPRTSVTRAMKETDIEALLTRREGVGRRLRRSLAMARKRLP
jgi:peptidoglycan/xylan/chitin deacetylase (PgdA/CDA1 family)